MTDEQIIKALDCCHSELGNMCSICPLFDPDNDYCEDELHKNALDLINRQNNEIDNLKVELKVMRGAANLYKLELERKENELNALYKIMNKQDDETSELYRKVASRENLEESFLKTTKEFDKRLEKTVKAERREAIKEFAERLKEYELCMFCSFPDNKSLGSNQYMVLSDSIDNLVEEMTEEDV